jgi:hypothetical protein
MTLDFRPHHGSVEVQVVRNKDVAGAQGIVKAHEYFADRPAFAQTHFVGYARQIRNKVADDHAFGQLHKGIERVDNGIAHNVVLDPTHLDDVGIMRQRRIQFGYIVHFRQQTRGFDIKDERIAVVMR